VLAAIDLFGDGLDVVLIGPSIEFAGGPVPDRRQPLPWIGVDRIGIGDKIGRVITLLAAPVAKLPVIAFSSDLDAGAAPVLVPVAIALRRIAEVGARVIPLLRCSRPPDFLIVPKRSAFVHELRQ